MPTDTHHAPLRPATKILLALAVLLAAYFGLGNLHRVMTPDPTYSCSYSTVTERTTCVKDD